MDILSRLISALAVLLGVLVGGALSYSTEKRRWQREDARRFDLERRLAYTKFLRVVNQLNSARSDFSGDGRIPKELLSAFEDALIEIELIATAAVYKRVSYFADVVGDKIINRNPSRLPENAWYIARKALIETIHNEMGIESHYASLPADDDV